MDLPNALTDDTLLQMCVTFNLEPDDVLLTSAKSGLGVALLLPAIVSKVPPPKSMFGRDGPCRARVVDSWFDDHRGVICLVQVQPPFFRHMSTRTVHGAVYFYELRTLLILCVQTLPLFT